MRLTELTAEFMAGAVRDAESAEETAEAARRWAADLETALAEVAARRGIVLVSAEAVVAGAVDYTAEVRWPLMGFIAEACRRLKRGPRRRSPYRGGSHERFDAGTAEPSRSVWLRGGRRGVAARGFADLRERQLVGQRLGVFRGADGLARCKGTRIGRPGRVRAAGGSGREGAVPEDGSRAARRGDRRGRGPPGLDRWRTAGPGQAVRARRAPARTRGKRHRPAGPLLSFTPITSTATTAATPRSAWCRGNGFSAGPRGCRISPGSDWRARSWVRSLADGSPADGSSGRCPSYGQRVREAPGRSVRGARHRGGVAGGPAGLGRPGGGEGPGCVGRGLADRGAGPADGSCKTRFGNWSGSAS